MSKYTERPCPQCLLPFTPNNSQQKYCRRELYIRPDGKKISRCQIRARMFRNNKQADVNELRINGGV